MANGLPKNHINCINSDANGNVWIGTESGASKYDGKTWKTFTIVNGLSNNHVECIATDNSNVLWFGTKGGSISKLTY